MTPLREVVVGLVTSFITLLAAIFSLVFLVPWMHEHPVETWSPAAQTARSVAGVVLHVIVGVIVAFIFGLTVAITIDGKRRGRAEKLENHRFTNESTPNRLVIARYTAAGERHIDLDVPLDRQLWLVPTDDIIAFDSYRVATAPYAALIDHAPLYDRWEGQSFAEATKRPSIVGAHKPLWTRWARFESADRKNGHLDAIRDAFRHLIASGAVIAHIDIDTWEPKVPTDAKFRTHWKWTPPADPSAA